jgi:hypothetical protein
MLRQLRSPSQQWLFLKVVVFATAVPLLFRLKLSALSRVLERRITSARSPKADPTRTDQIIRCVEIARVVGNPVVRPKCLTRAVTLYYFLRRAGMDLTLCFGAARKHGRLVEAIGHCWLVKNGEPFLEAHDPRTDFVPIYWLPNSLPGPQVSGLGIER